MWSIAPVNTLYCQKAALFKATFALLGAEAGCLDKLPQLAK